RRSSSSCCRTPRATSRVPNSPSTVARHPPRGRSSSPTASRAPRRRTESRPPLSIASIASIHESVFPMEGSRSHSEHHPATGPEAARGSRRQRRHTMHRQPLLRRALVAGASVTIALLALAACSTPTPVETEPAGGGSDAAALLEEAYAGTFQAPPT